MTEEDWAAARAAGSATVLRGTTIGEAKLPATLLQEVINAARTGLPNEACGLLVGPGYAADGAVPTRFIALANAAQSPYRYLISPHDLLKVVELEDDGEFVWGIVHSHVASPAEPSATDIGLAYYPDSLYLICSLANPAPEVRAWSIREGAVHEVSLAVS